MAVSHYLNILDRQRDVVIPHVVFGGKNPHPHYIVGGMPCAISMNDMNAPINTQRLAAVEQSIALAKDLVSNFYLPDLLAIGKIYVEKGMVDGGGLAKNAFCLMAIILMMRIQAFLMAITIKMYRSL